MHSKLLSSIKLTYFPSTIHIYKRCIFKSRYYKRIWDTALACIQPWLHWSLSLATEYFRNWTGLLEATTRADMASSILTLLSNMKSIVLPSLRFGNQSTNFTWYNARFTIKYFTHRAVLNILACLPQLLSYTCLAYAPSYKFQGAGEKQKGLKGNEEMF